LTCSGKFVTGLAVAALGGAFAAGSGTAANAPTTCTVPPATAQPFLQWNDHNSYYVAPGGAFEQMPSGWRFTGTVETVSGNESYHVNNPSDSRSLWFGTNSYAQSTDLCVNVHSPSIRLFVLNTGDAGSTLQVILNYTDKNGKPQSPQVASLTNSGTWSPSSPIRFLNNVAPVVGGQGQTTVSFTFHVIGHGNWQIDDLYIDPIKSQ
jgi:hypothetical protein